MTWMDLKKNAGEAFMTTRKCTSLFPETVDDYAAPDEEANCQIPNGRQTAQKTSQIKAIDR